MRTFHSNFSPSDDSHSQLFVSPDNSSAQSLPVTSHQTFWSVHVHICIFAVKDFVGLLCSFQYPLSAQLPPLCKCAPSWLLATSKFLEFSYQSSQFCEPDLFSLASFFLLCGQVWASWQKARVILGLTSFVSFSQGSQFCAACGSRSESNCVIFFFPTLPIS